MAGSVCLVITSIAGPTPALRSLAAEALESETRFILVGDVSSPAWPELAGCDYYSLERQRELPFELAALCPIGHYARKNLGYLVAMGAGATVIVETDDDTIAQASFWTVGERDPLVRSVVGANGWVNVYRYFSEAMIWPRGLPLAEVRAVPPAYSSLPTGRIDCPIQQGLVDDDPDVDAIYRMLFELPFRFDRGEPVALTAGAWCPFNSQNTSWWSDAFPLMYLPASCSFRMTDIWRSFVAQRIAWANGWSILFHAATVSQNRNAHDLNQDFADEMHGYLENDAIRAALDTLEIAPGPAHLSDNMRRAYELLVARGWLHESELALVEAWLADVENLRSRPPAVAVER